MNVATQPYVGIIIGAMIAALVSFLGLLISKESKTSEFRQAWIDGVREDLALIVAGTYSIYLTKQRGLKAGDEHALDLSEATTASNAASARLAMRLNPKEAEAQNLIRAVTALEAVFVDPTTGMTTHLPPWSRVTELEKAVTDAGSILLKKEWRRVKRGEPVFFAAKWTFLGLLIVIGVWTLSQPR